MKDLAVRKSFERDLKRIARRGYDRDMLDAVIDQLREGELLPQARRDHPLKGEWRAGASATSSPTGCSYTRRARPKSCWPARERTPICLERERPQHIQPRGRRHGHIAAARSCRMIRHVRGAEV